MPTSHSPTPTPRPEPAARGTPRTLQHLIPRGELADLPAGAGDLPISGITSRSNEVTTDSVFVAIRGTSADGHDFVEDAARRGAAAIVVESMPAEDPGVPVIRTTSSRKLLAHMAAEWYGRPADRLSMVGITGTMGKTSTLAMLESALTAGDRRVGSLGSLGLRIQGETLEETGFTAPDPLVLQQELARAGEEGCELVLMEVTSHGLDQERVAGLEYDLGILTNLVPLEHQDYHGSFKGYLEAKRRFFDHLDPCAPLVYNIDNLATRRLVHEYQVEPVGCGTARSAMVRIEPREVGPAGTRLVLNVRRAIPRVRGGEIAPFRLPLEMQLLGRSNVSNAALAATAALSLGVDPDVIRDSLAHFPPPRRRMQIVHQGSFSVIDDTVGHPDSISAVFEVAEAFSPRRIHIVFAVRGKRGKAINRQSARTVAIWAARSGPETLVVTRSEEAADERNRVEEAEVAAFREPLREQGVRFEERGRLDEAIGVALGRAREGDLVLLLGAQGMDAGQEITRRWLAERPRGSQHSR